MLFTSLVFVAFFAIVFTLYRALPFRAQNPVLLIASYVFYGWWDHRYLALIAISTSVDFLAGLCASGAKVERSHAIIAWLWAATFVLLSTVSIRGATPPFAREHGLVALAALTLAAVTIAVIARKSNNPRRFAVIVSLVVNLGMLGVFKYFNFFVDSANTALLSVGLDPTPWRLDLVLPVGISFYTFQTLSYSIDVYRGRCAPTYSFLNFALFVSFFPQLVAGPIERASRLLPQVEKPRTIDAAATKAGLYLVLLGFFRKLVIADGIAPSVDAVFQGSTVGFTDVIAAGLGFGLQIYGDFAGYSAIARGIAKVMGFDLMKNFAVPYGSKSPSEFWRRWHISLSTWLRDYLYIPLGGNRHGTLMTYRNLMLTMLLGGLWHGAAWNFVAWGLYHGLLLSVFRRFEGSFSVPVPKFVRWAFFLALTAYGWILFRAESMQQIIDLSHAFLTFDPTLMRFVVPPFSCLAGLPILLLLDVYEYRRDDENFLSGWSPILRGAVFAALITTTLAATTVPGGEQFIYFQF